MLVTVMLLSCCVPYYVVLLLDVMFVHVLHLSCLVCMYPNCFVAFPLYILVHGCPCFFIISNWTHKPHFWVLMQSSGQFWRWTIEVSNQNHNLQILQYRSINLTHKLNFLDLLQSRGQFWRWTIEVSNQNHRLHFWVLVQSNDQFWRWTIEASNLTHKLHFLVLPQSRGQFWRWTIEV